MRLQAKPAEPLDSVGSWFGPAYVSAAAEIKKANFEEAGEWTEYEKQLLLTLLDLPKAVAKSITEYDPHHLIDHVYAVASVFSRFYAHDAILKAEPAVAKRRLVLVERVQSQLQLLFNLLGVDAPEKL